jgi:hypothetical protein
MSTYDITDLGRIHHLLGMRIRYEKKKRMIIDQEKYTEEKIKQFGLEETKTVSTPADYTTKLKTANDEEVMKSEKDVTKYRGYVGSLIYASISTRPDVTFATNQLSRHMNKPTQQHMTAATRVFRYLRDHTNTGLEYHHNVQDIESGVRINAFCDSDWGGDSDDRKSTSGYCVFINNNLVSWNTRKQQTVALSSAEAELMAMTEARKEVIWCYHLLSEMHVKVKLPIKLYIDNRSTINIAKNNTDHTRTKHIDIRHHAIKEDIKNNMIELVWVPTDQQIADIFTKNLGPKHFIKFKEKLMTTF